MAQYSENFAEKTLNELPAGWTPRWYTSEYSWTVLAGGEVGGRYLHQTPSNFNRRMLSWDAIDSDVNRADCEILARVRSGATPGFFNYLVARGSGVGVGEANSYWVAFENQTLVLHRYINGSPTQLDVADYTRSANTWHWIRFRVNGTSLQARAWADGDPEPEQWMVSAEDSTHTGPGWTGVQTGTFRSNDWDYISVGTDGDSALFPSGTLYAEDFSEKTLNESPAGWTGRWNTANANWSVLEGGLVGGRFLRQASSGSHRRLLTWDAIDSDANRADTDILALTRTTHTSGFHCFLVARASGALGSENGYLAALHGGTQLRVYRYLNGSSTQLAAANYLWSTNTWYWLRFRVNGTTLQAKVWQEHDPEPETWMVTTTDSQITDPGWVGVQSFEFFGDIDFDRVAVATGGLSAPALDNTGPLRLSQQPLEVLSQPENPAGRLSQLTVEVLWSETSSGGGGGPSEGMPQRLWGGLWTPMQKPLWTPKGGGG